MIHNKPKLGTPIIENHHYRNGLVAMWLFNQQGGNTLVDVVNGYNGTFSGSGYWRAGAGYFDGTNNYVDCGDADIIANGQQTSIVTRVRTDFTESYASDSCIFDKSDAPHLRFESGTNGFKFGITTSTGTEYVDAFGFDFGVGTWHHIACVYDGKYAMIYYNGYLYDADARTGTIDENNSDFIIGARTNLANKWIGLIDYIRIYDHALTQQEVYEMYTNPYADYYTFDIDKYYVSTTSAFISRGIGMGIYRGVYN